MSGKSTVLGAMVVVTVLNVAVRAEVVAPTLASGWYGGTFPKNRYISIDPTAESANLGETFAIRVTLTDNLQFADAEGMTWWVGAPDENCLAGLRNDEEGGFIVMRNWDGCPALQIGDCGIVPISDYRVWSVDSDGDSPTFLDVETIRQPGGKWYADCIGSFTGPNGNPPDVWTPPQGTVGIDDTVAIIKTFKDITASNATPVSVSDIHPQVPNRIANIDDVLYSIFGHQGRQYPYGCPHDPCQDNVAVPCP